MGLAVAAARRGGAQRLAAVRGWWRVQHPPPSVRQRLDVAYTTAITAAIVGALAYGTAISALAQVVTPDRLAVLGPALAAPRPGARDALGRLPRAGGVHRRPTSRSCSARRCRGAGSPPAASCSRSRAGRRREQPSPASRSWASPERDAASRRIAPRAWSPASRSSASSPWRAPGRFSARRAGIARRGGRGGPRRWPPRESRPSSDAGPLGRTIALWSGPWGWAVQPGAGAGGAWPAALLLLTLVTAVAAVVAVRGCGACSAERHLRRAEGRASAVASLASFDARTARRTLERVGARDAGRPLAQLRRVRSARLAVAWRDVVAALRTPARVVEAAALAGGGTVLALLAADRPAALAVAPFAVYLGASRMLWPLRAELDVPERTRILLRPRLGRILLEHALVPVVVTTTAAALAVAGCAVAGTPPAAVALLAVAVTPVLTLCAAMSARREGRLPSSVLATAIAVDPSGGAAAVVAWLTFWPALATTLGAVPLIAVTSGGPAVVAMAALWTAIATLALARLVQSPHHSG